MGIYVLNDVEFVFFSQKILSTHFWTHEIKIIRCSSTLYLHQSVKIYGTLLLHTRHFSNTAQYQIFFFLSIFSNVYCHFIFTIAQASYEDVHCTTIKSLFFEKLSLVPIK